MSINHIYTFPDVPPNYSLDTVISNLEKAKQSLECEVALFMGRMNHQEKPNMPHCKWFTLDIAIHAQYEWSTHFQMDFNKKELMERIKFCFDKVVFDFSVFKFLQSPWKVVHMLLKRTSSASVFFELDVTGGGYPSGPKFKYTIENVSMTVPEDELIARHKDIGEKFTEWKNNRGEEEAENEYQNFLKTLSEEYIKNSQRFHRGEKGLRNDFTRFILASQLQYNPKRIEDKYLEILFENHIKPYLLENYFHDVQIIHCKHPYLAEQEQIQRKIKDNQPFFLLTGPKENC